MDIQLDSRYRYEYHKLPELHTPDDIDFYVSEAEKIFPKFEKKPERIKTPKFDNQTVKKVWEKEQIRRCIEGYDGITGKMYFYYNFCHIKNISGGIIKPEFRGADALWFHLIESCGPNQYNEGQGVICLKRRRSGFSWKEAADMLHDVLFKIGANVGTTSKSERDANRLFYWMKLIYDRLPDFLRAPISSQSADKITFARKRKTKDGNRELSGHQSTVYAVAPTNNCFEGDMLTKMIVDEVGKISNVETIWAMSKDCLMEETIRKGIPIMFGTAGEQDGIGKGQREFWTKSSSYDLQKFFFPGWAGLYVDENGNDDIRGAVEHILKNRRKKLEDGANDYWDYVQQYPLNVKEALMMKDGAGIGNIKKVREQEYELECNPVKSTKGKFRWGNPGEPTVVFEPNTVVNSEGQCVIYEHPKPELSYSAGCDPADHDYVNKGSSDLSMYIMSKQKGIRPPKIVFSYTDRPEKVNDYYDQGLMALIYFNETKVLIENNRNGMIQYFQNNGYIHLLMPEPQAKNLYNVQQSKRIGVRKTVNSGKEMERCINEYTNDFCDLIPDRELLLEFLVYGEENTDRVIAFGWTLVSMEAEVVSREEEERMKSLAPVWRLKNVGGKIIRVNKK